MSLCYSLIAINQYSSSFGNLKKRREDVRSCPTSVEMEGWLSSRLVNGISNDISFVGQSSHYHKQNKTDYVLHPLKNHPVIIHQ